jgi:carbonic anhydrase
MPTDDTRSPWAVLRDGNARYVEGRSTADARRGSQRRSELVGAQTPTAIVLGCADSRVPVEILFDQGLGDLFVVRTAGHVVDGAVLGSIEYAVQCLNVPSIVIVGHDGCGAVAAAIAMVDEGAVPSGCIREVAERIAPHIVRARIDGVETFEATVEQHACHTAELLSERSSLIDGAVRAGRLTVTAARYSLSTGLVTEAVPLRRLLPV